MQAGTEFREPVGAYRSAAHCLFWRSGAATRHGVAICLLPREQRQGVGVGTLTKPPWSLDRMPNF